MNIKKELSEHISEYLARNGDNSEIKLSNVPSQISGDYSFNRKAVPLFRSMDDDMLLEIIMSYEYTKKASLVGSFVNIEIDMMKVVFSAISNKDDVDTSIYAKYRAKNIINRFPGILASIEEDIILSEVERGLLRLFIENDIKRLHLEYLDYINHLELLKLDKESLTRTILISKMIIGA